MMSRDESGAVEKVVDVMSVTVSQLLEHLHHVTKHLEFWKRLSKVISLDRALLSCSSIGFVVAALSLDMLAG